MKLLAQIEEKYPMLTTILGTASAAFTWLVQWIGWIEGFARFVATIAAAGVAVLSFMLRWRAWSARQAPPRVPPDVEDDIPL